MTHMNYDRPACCSPRSRWTHAPGKIEWVTQPRRHGVAMSAFTNSENIQTCSLDKEGGADRQLTHGEARAMMRAHAAAAAAATYPHVAARLEREEAKVVSQQQVLTTGGGEGIGMQFARLLGGTVRGQCIGRTCGKMLTAEDKDHALCNACWAATFDPPANKQPAQKGGGPKKADRGPDVDVPTSTDDVHVDAELEWERQAAFMKAAMRVA